MSIKAKAPQVGDSVPTYHKIDKDNALFMNNWGGKSLCTYGDSITAQGKWQPKVDSVIGFDSVAINGHSGFTISGLTGLNSKSLITALPTTDLLLLMGGTNDWALNTPLGSVKKANVINNKMSTLDGYFINWNTGATQASGSYTCSEFYFEVEASTTYVFSNVWHYAEYDTGKSRVNGANNGSETEFEVTTSATTQYIRVSGSANAGGFTNAIVYKKDDVSTFSGAVSIAVERIRLEKPNTEVVLMGTPFGKFQDRSMFSDKYGLINNEGLSTVDYSNAMMEVAKYHGVPFINVSELAGWGDTNIDDYVTFDGALLHPNDLGATKIANGIVGSLLSINPRVS